MSEFKNIICLSDLLSYTHSTPDAIFDLIREPIRQACNIHIGHSPRSHGLPPNFNLQKFQELAQPHPPLGPEMLWAATFHQMPPSATNYLLDHLPSAAFFLCCEMPPWLRRICMEHGFYFLDLRYSPLHFGQDLYIALDTNHPTLRTRLQQASITSDELRLEAALLGANLRAHRSRLKEMHRHLFNIEDALIYIPQPKRDKSLLSPNGKSLQTSDFADQLHTLAAGRRLLVMMDYMDLPMHSAGVRDCESLSSMLKTSVRPCPQNAYQILSAHENVELIGINSPILQEAPWFGKKSYNLEKPFTPLADIENTASNGYLQVHFTEILAPDFWHRLLTPDIPKPRIPHLPLIARNYGREVLDEWREYEKVLNWERPFQQRAFDRSGGIVHRRRLDALENRPTPPTVLHQKSAPVNSMQARMHELKDTHLGETAYILGNAASLLDLDINELMQRESFWFNKAFALKNQGYKFHPKYYFLYDAPGIQQWMDDILKIQSDIKFFGKEVYKFIEINQPEILSQQKIIALDINPTGNYMFEDENNFSYDPSQIIYSGETSVIAAIQIAFFMGYQRVLIGGVDLDYSQPYFYGETAPSRNGLQDVVTERMRQSFKVAKKHFEKNNRILAKITNSPHLPLDYIPAPDVYKKNPPSQG